MVTNLVTRLSDILWGPPMLLLIFGIGLYLSIRTGFFQVFHIKTWLKETLGGSKKKKSGNGNKEAISPLKALLTALGGSIGVGSIAGVASAIAIGGPGAVFWMWASAILGMMTKYAEIYLALLYRKRDCDGGYRGGPMYYLCDGLNCKPLGILFAIFTALATFGIGSMCQSGTISTIVSDQFSPPKYLVGILLVLAYIFIFRKGMKGVTRVTSVIVPIIDALFIFCGATILFLHAPMLPGIFSSIFKSAFEPLAMGGGLMGVLTSKAVRSGVSRGIFSNEAGLGSSPIVHAAAASDEPQSHAFWGILEVGIGTLVVCTLSALVILVAAGYNPSILGETDAARIASGAFEQMLPGFGTGFIQVVMSVFAFIAPLGWCLYGQFSIQFLFGERSKWAVPLYQCLFLASVFIGTLIDTTLIWSLSDVLNALMALPNLIALFALSGKAIGGLREYKQKNLPQYRTKRVAKQ